MMPPKYLPRDQLTPAQIEALSHARSLARTSQKAAQATIVDILVRARLDQPIFNKAVNHIKSQGQVALHFHPDRPNQKGQTVAEALLEEGVYRSQFETKISNGGLTAFQGGQRDDWEQRLFGGAYQKPDVTPSERPKYGALDLMNHADGPAPRFGSCYFRLSNAVCQRCTFTYQDSVSEPDVFGTIHDLAGIMAATLTDVETHQACFGAQDLTVTSVLQRLSHIENKPVNYSENFGRALDDYIEAQIHGSINLEADVITLVADPSFQSTKTGQVLSQLCTQYDIRLDWHAGFQVQASAIPDDFRGPEIPRLASRIMGQGQLNTAMVGEAALSLYQQPDQWRDLGTYAEVLQYIKQLWHALVTFGQPFISN
ncbi:MAG: DUF3626 domain-containing protein [Chloroflexota bacterium]